MLQTPTLLDERQCAQCRTKTDNNSLPHCRGCMAVRYCSKQCQIKDWATHKARCTPVKKARALMKEEETRLRNHPGDWMTPPNPFNTPGHFWGMLETRDYMRAKAGYIHMMKEMKTREALGIALVETLDVFHLNRSDNMGMRYQAPATMIRLGKDQEAYDFIKWWATVRDTDFDWDNLDKPYLNLSGEDVLEPVQVLMKDKCSLELSHAIALTLLKLRLLFELQSLKEVSSAAEDLLLERLPQELVDRIREGLVSGILANHQEIRKDVRDGVDISSWICLLERQTDLLLDHIKAANSFFWAAMLEPEDHLAARPEAYSAGDFREVQVFLQANHPAWEETPGAIAWVWNKFVRLVQEWNRKPCEESSPHP